MRRIVPTILLWSAIAARASAQSPCPQPGELISRIDAEPGALAVLGQHVLVASDTELQVFDYGVPAAPQLAGTLPLPGPTRLLTAAGQHAYLQLDDARLLVIDLSDFSAPSIASSTQMDCNGGALLALPGGCIHACRTGGVRSFRRESDSSLAAVSLHPPYVYFNSMVHAGGHVYLSGGTALIYGFEVGIDLSLGPLPAIATEHSVYRIASDGDQLYAHERVSYRSSKLSIYDLDDPAAPTHVQSLSTRPASFLVRTADQLLAGNDVLWRKSVGDAWEPAMSRIHLGRGAPLNFDGMLLAQLTDGRLELRELPVAEDAITYSTLPLDGLPQRIASSGDQLFVASGSLGLHQLELDEQGTPSLRATIPTTGVCVDVEVQGDRMAVADYDAGLRLFQQSEGGVPHEIGRYLGSGRTRCLAFVGELIYAGIDQFGIVVLDATDPANFVMVGSIPLQGPIADIEVEGPWAAVAVQGLGVAVLRLDDPRTPSLHEWLWPNTRPVDVDVDGDWIFVAGSYAGMRVYAVSLEQEAAPVSFRGIRTQSFTVADGQVYQSMDGELRVFGRENFSAGIGAIWFQNEALGLQTVVADGRVLLVSSDGLLTSLPAACIESSLTRSVTRTLHAPLLRSVLPNPSLRGFEFALEVGLRGPLELRVFDARGRLVHSQTQPVVGHSLRWDGLDRAGRSVAAGVYYLSVQADGRADSRKLLVLEGSSR